MLTAFSLFSCSQDDVILTESDADSNTTFKTLNGQIPFTVENVQSALVNVLNHYSEKRPAVVQRFAAYQVNTTHMYYKFTPADSLQYAALMEQDDVLGLTTDPFEHNVVERTEDPAEDEIPVFYAVVSVETQLPEVPYQVVAELHFTDEDKLEDIPANYDEVEFKQNLMYEARKLAGHLDNEEIAEGYMNYEEGFDDSQNNGGKTTYGLFGKKWRPSGTIRVEEDVLTALNDTRVKFYVPVKGAQVNVLKWGWLRVEYGTTDNNGNFSTGTTYTKEVHYNVKFKGTYSHVKEGNMFDIANWKSGKHKKGALNANFQLGTREQFHALVFNAAYDYFTRVIPLYNITYPHFPVTINAKYNTNGSEFIVPIVPFTSTVRIGRLKNGDYRNSDGIYGTTVHELTHASHHKMDGGFYNKNTRERKLMKESYCEGAETIMTNQRYRMLYGNGYRGSNGTQHANTNGWNGRMQRTTIADMTAYTPLVIDLVDELNQSTINPNFPVDRVSGYTLKQIQDALNGSRSLDDWKNKLINNYNNPTEGFIDDVFDYAQEALNNNW